MEILIEVERFFLIFVTAISIGGFLFTLRHRGYYSVWARSSILMGAISSFFLTFTCNFDVVSHTNLNEYSEPLFASIHILTSLSLLLFTYTILRFKWKWHTECRLFSNGKVYCEDIPECKYNLDINSEEEVKNNG